ncbi:putative WD repeat domain phosphoinositide-interacting protein [Histomonas meleagridis]|uniref:putative WD repeat domain phosphoinositide-interacting protein n=1 Tax=Histomonas meleagridis TaxID=135588 RepID=UPI003559EC5A|nr:putative WD repeat domain phosphoinositide-interacting protein [Histomonas meleagridis]KAH0804858.1 putative WD repeat domain phosphoinositide-interacting protein [Histomonas meleagridis]
MYPIRSLCYNDDRETFTAILPSQYLIFRCEPFGMIFSRECEDLSLGNVATYNGYRFIALTGSPSPHKFNSKSVRIFDHESGKIKFENQFPDHILTIALGRNVLICCMNQVTEVWNIETHQQIQSFKSGMNVHVPMALSHDSSSLIISARNAKDVYLLTGISGSVTTKEVEAHSTAVSCVTFSDDGKYFATAAFSGTTIRIWDSSTQRCAVLLKRNTSNDIIRAMDFSPTNDFFVSLSNEGVVKVYDIRRKVSNAKAQTPPVATLELGQQMPMGRICWINSMIIGIISLNGSYYKLSFNGSSLSNEKITFISRE